jgi:hypothetical protein
MNSKCISSICCLDGAVSKHSYSFILALILTNSLTCALTDLPGPPSAPEVTDITKQSCSLSWKAPETDGGAEIIGYHVERCAGQSSRWIRITKDLIQDRSFAVQELIEDNMYEFRVYAVNKVGDGPAGPKSDPIKARDPWGMFCHFVGFLYLSPGFQNVNLRFDI